MGYHIAKGSYKEILKEGIGGYPFGMPDYQTGSVATYSAAVKKIYNEKKAKLDKAWSDSKKSKWEVAVIFHEICVSGAYMAYDDKRYKLDTEWKKAHPSSSWRDSPYSVVGSVFGIANLANLIVFAKEEYGICRTDLYNMLAVVEEFGHSDGTITYEASLFSFSQLVEMLTLTYEERKKIQPNWTVAEIRDYKKSLKTISDSSVQTSGQAYDKTESSVQTSGQIEEPLNERYKRFEKFTRVDLCEKIFSLEKELAECKKKLEMYNK